MEKSANIMKYCKFHFSERKKCKFGKKCKFIHDKNVVLACPYFMNKENKCAHGEECWYFHLFTKADIDSLVDQMEVLFHEKFSSLRNENLELRKKIEECEKNCDEVVGRNTGLVDQLSSIQNESVELQRRIKECESKLEMGFSVEKDTDTSFQVGEMVEIYHEQFAEPEWTEGMIRNRDSEGYVIQTLFRTFWNVPQKKIRHLGNEKVEEICKSKYNPILQNVEGLKRKLKKMKLKGKG